MVCITFCVTLNAHTLELNRVRCVVQKDSSSRPLQGEVIWVFIVNTYSPLSPTKLRGMERVLMNLLEIEDKVMLNLHFQF